MNERKTTRRQRTFTILTALGAVFVGMQFFKIDRTNPTVFSDIVVPAQVKAVLRRACYDCHSNETEWPWYGYVAPASWIVASDVRQGRNAMNFSLWNRQVDKHDLKEKIRDKVRKGEMPPWLYSRLHPEAGLSQAEMDTVSAWVVNDGAARISASKKA